MIPPDVLQATFTVPNYHQRLSASRPVQVYTYYFETPEPGAGRAPRSRRWECGQVHEFSDVTQLPPHDHEHHEIALVVAGQGVHQTAQGRQAIERGAVLTVVPGEVHAFEHADGLVMVNCTYLTEYLFPDLREVLGVDGLAPLFFHGTMYGGSLRASIPQWSIDEETLERCVAELQDIARERSREDPSSRFMRTALEKLMLILLRAYVESSEPVLAPVEPAIRTALEHIEGAIADGEPLDLGLLARGMRTSRDLFARRFRKATGMTPTDYYQHRRVQRACCLLLERNRDATSVAHELGYYDSAHFSRLFRKYRGISPKAFQTKYADI